MINRLLYVATATALISVFMFDENFAANLSQAIGEPINIVPRGSRGGRHRRRAGRRRLLPRAASMKTWHAVAFLIVTAIGAGRGARREAFSTQAKITHR